MTPGAAWVRDTTPNARPANEFSHRKSILCDLRVGIPFMVLSEAIINMALQQSSTRANPTPLLSR
jgi:hypothetical protein